MGHELVGVGEAAALLGCHRVTIDKLVKGGRLAAITLPKAYRRAGVWRYFKRSDIEKLAAEASWRRRTPRAAEAAP